MTSNNADSEIPAGPQWDAWRFEPVDARAIAALPDPERAHAELRQIAHFGLLAPTSHNSVPQRFRLRPSERVLELWIDRKFVLPGSDRNGRQASVSLGCVIQSCMTAARCLGLDAELRLHADVADIAPHGDGERYVHVADLAFFASNEPPLDASWMDAMLQRKVVRAEFDETRLPPPELIAEAHRRVHAFAGLELHLLSDSATRFFFGKFQQLADTTVLNLEQFSRELGDWLLPADSASFVGMRGAEYGLSDEAADKLHRGLCRQRALLPDEIAGFARVSYSCMRASAGIAVITVERDDLVHRISAGRAYDDVALLLQTHGFRTSVHAAIVEVDGPNLALRGRLRTRRRPTVVFRIGIPRRPEEGQRPHAARPRLDSVILPTGTT